MLQFINSARFMASWVSDLVKNISEGVHKSKNRYKHDDENYGITYEVCHCFLEYTTYAVTKDINKCLIKS